MLPIIAGDKNQTYNGRMMKWGLIPFWDKSDKPKIAPINARSEDVLSKPMFKQSLQRRRCIVPVDGFFEWKKSMRPQRSLPHPAEGIRAVLVCRRLRKRNREKAAEFRDADDHA